MAPNSNLENLIVIQSFTHRAQPSSDKLSGDVTGMVLVRLVGGYMGDIHCIADAGEPF